MANVLGLRLASSVGLAALLTGCPIETKTDLPSIDMVNARTEPVDIHYLTEDEGVTPANLEYLRRSLITLEPGQRWATGVPGNDSDGCLDWPLVARDPSGDEVDRLPPGFCANNDAEPEWTIE